MNAPQPVDGVSRRPWARRALGVLAVLLLAALAWAAMGPADMRRSAALAAVAGLLLLLLLHQLRQLYAARDALEASRQRFAFAVAGSDDGIWDWDLVTQRIYVSARARELLGVPDSKETQSKDELFRRMQMHPDDAQRREEALNAHLDGRTPAFEGEYRVTHPGGSMCWVHVRGVCVRDAAGRPVRIAGSISDIDARKRAEQALRQSEERYAIAMIGMNVAHWVWDVGNDDVFASKNLASMVGLAPEALPTKGRDWLTSVPLHPDDKRLLVDAVDEHLAGRTARIDVEYRVFDRSTNGYRWVQTRGQCFRDGHGRAQRVAGATVDISERKRTQEALRQSERALRESEERYQLAVDGANEGLWDWDLPSDQLFLSPRAQQVLSLDPGGEPRRPRRDWIALATYHAEDVPRTRDALRAHLEGRTPHFDVEYRLRHADGTWHWYRQHGVALRNPEGRAYRMAGSMEDVTDRKNAEADRDRLGEQLRQAQKLEAMGTLAGGIAHDFNNILAAILGYGEMAQKEAPEGTGLRRHVDATLSAGMRAKSLVERILAFSRSGMGERTPVHVQAVVAEVLEQIAASLPRGIRLERMLDAGDAAVLGDATQIHQVVMNLCANAVQAIGHDGTVCVSVDTVDLDEPKCVTTSQLAAGPYVRVIVCDTGVGVPPRVLERIFDPFFTTRDIGVGTGLGLSLVHGIVTDLGGGVDVASRPGEGTTMTVYLPREASLAAAAAVQEEPAALGNGQTVLFVDDEVALVRLGEELLAQLGYEPVGFESSTKALECFRAEPQRFDLVLSDEAMPAMTGTELVQQIRSIRAEIPIVLMSGYVSAALAARARELGVVEILGKPLASRDIARSLSGALRATASAGARAPA